MKIFVKVLSVLAIVCAILNAIVSLIIGQLSGLVLSAFLLILGLLMMRANKKGEYEIDHIVNAGRKGRDKIILIIHYKSGRVKTKYVYASSAEFKMYAPYIR